MTLPVCYLLTSFPNPLPLYHPSAPVLLTPRSNIPAMCSFLGFALDFSLLERLFPQMSYMAISLSSFKSLLKCPSLSDIYHTLNCNFPPRTLAFISPYNALFFSHSTYPLPKTIPIYLFATLLFPVYATHWSVNSIITGIFTCFTYVFCVLILVPGTHNQRSIKYVLNAVNK